MTDRVPLVTPASSFPVFAGFVLSQEVSPSAGGMGVVYKAREVSLDRLVAIKTMRADVGTMADREFFVREARAAAKLDHPNIVRIYGFHPEHDPPFYVMQFVEGRPLLEACRGRSFAFIAEVVEKAARALAYAHAHGIIHRDVKSGNILVDFNGEPHVADFGLAWPLDVLKKEQSAQGNRLAGTASHIAPEVYEGGAVGPQIDVYALGVVLYQLLTGHLPFAGNTLQELRRAVLEDEPPMPQELNPSVPEPLQRVCLKAMERNPNARYRTAGAMAEDLARFRQGHEVTARPTRYYTKLQGNLQNHLTEIGLWHEQRLIDTQEKDRLARPYRALLTAAYPWHELIKQFPWESIVLRLGGWLVLVSSVLWPVFYWELLSHRERVLVIAFPTLAMNAVGWILYRRANRLNALAYLSTGALLLPLFVAVATTEYDIIAYRQPDSWELFANHGGGEAFAPSNARMLVASAAFVSYSVVLLLATKARFLCYYVGSGLYLLYSSSLLLMGMKYWLEHEHVSRALLLYFGFSLLLWPASLALDRCERLRPWASICFAFFLVPAVLCLTALARYGATEWLHADAEWDSQAINLWLMGNGVLYLAGGMVARHATQSFVRGWSEILLILVPVHWIATTNLVFEKGWHLFELRGRSCTVYEVLSVCLCVALVVLGSRLRRNTVAIPALLGLAIWVLRVTERHFDDYLDWPLALALTGTAAMGLALFSLTLRGRHRVRSH